MIRKPIQEGLLITGKSAVLHPICYCPVLSSECENLCYGDSNKAHQRKTLLYLRLNN